MIFMIKILYTHRLLERRIAADHRQTDMQIWLQKRHLAYKHYLLEAKPYLRTIVLKATLSDYRFYYRVLY